MFESILAEFQSSHAAYRMEFWHYRIKQYAHLQHIILANSESAVSLMMRR